MPGKGDGIDDLRSSSALTMRSGGRPDTDGNPAIRPPAALADDLLEIVEIFGWPVGERAGRSQDRGPPVVVRDRRGPEEDDDLRLLAFRQFTGHDLDAATGLNGHGLLDGVHGLSSHLQSAPWI